MGKFCLMASSGYPPGIVYHQDQGMSRVVKDCQPYSPWKGAKQEAIRSDSLNLNSHQPEPWEPLSGLCESNQFVKLESTVTRPMLIHVQDNQPDLEHFSLGIVKQCTRREKVLQLLTSTSSEAEGTALDFSVLSVLTGLQALSFDVHQQPSPSSLVYSMDEFYNQNPLLDCVGDMVRGSKISINPDGGVFFTGSGTEMNDFLSIVAEFYLSRKTTRWTKQSLLIPQFDRLPSIETQATVHTPFLTKKAATVAPVKSPQKIKVKPTSKKKNNKIGKERDLYRRNYFHAFECLLSLMINKRQNKKTAILSLKKSGTELPELLNHLSAGIAGTGLAVLFSVICKVSCGRVPFCGYKVLNTSLACALVWLSWAVNKLRDTIVCISKSASKTGLTEEEMMKRVDKIVKGICFRAATLLAVAVLRLA